MSNLGQVDQETPDVIGNVISLLLPAKKYNINCSWVKERPMPAIELFTCRLILLVDEIMPGEIKGYFGLSSREMDVLLHGLELLKLIHFNSKGHVLASEKLKDAYKGGSLNLVKYEERNELVILDRLTYSVMPRTRFARYMNGLPEVPTPKNSSLSNDEIIERFSKQYHSYLDFSKDDLDYKLYKVSTCLPEKPIQLLLDITVELSPSRVFEPRVNRNVLKRSFLSSDVTISNKLESAVSDYLGSTILPPGGIDFEDYCHLAMDSCLYNYLYNGEFNFSKFISDYQLNKTLYDTPETISIVGPIYLPENRKLISSLLGNLVNQKGERALDGECLRASWLTSNVPLWGANGEDLTEFTFEISDLLDRKDAIGSLTAIFPVEHDSHAWDLEQRFKNKIDNAVITTGRVEYDRLEAFVIPGYFGVIQYHIQPSKSSGVTVPVGYISFEPKRVDIIETIISKRLKAGYKSMSVAWSKRDETVEDLLNLDEKINLNHKLKIKPKSVGNKLNRPILSLNKKDHF